MWGWLFVLLLVLLFHHTIKVIIGMLWKHLNTPKWYSTSLPVIFPGIWSPMLQLFQRGDFLGRFLDPKLWFDQEGNVIKVCSLGASFTGAPVIGVSDADQMHEL